MARKGNLYTQYVKKFDAEISLKRNLKEEFRKEFKDWEKIKVWRRELKKIQYKRKYSKKKDLKKQYGAFAWKVKELRDEQTRQT